MSGPATTPVGPAPRDRLAGEVHLWLLPLRESIPPELERRWRELLSPEELAAQDRFRVAGARRQHLAARALARTSLSRYAAVGPADWRFRTGPEGKPEIAGPRAAPPLAFNLSHTRGLVACVVTLGRDAGVDVEQSTRRLTDPLALARHGFAPAERRALERLTGRARRELFCDLWTLKEAYVKARGGGFLALPARKVVFEIVPEGAARGTIRLGFEPGLEDRAGDWQVALLAPTDKHRLAVAVRRGAGPDLPLVTHQVEPAGSPPRRTDPPVLATTPPPPAPAGAAAHREPMGDR